MFHPKKIFKRIGPGVITGASDDDPSGIATYSQAGAQFGYQLLWLSLFTTPLMMAVQEMSARLGMVTGRGLAGILRRHVSAKVVLVLSLLLFTVNTINIGADLGAMAEAARLILPISSWLYLIVFAVIIIALEIFVSYRKYVNVLRWLTLALFSYVATAFVIQQDWWSIVQHTLVPTLAAGKDTWIIMVAVLGTTISPYLFFWQASEEVEEEIDSGRTTLPQRQQVTTKELAGMRRDVSIGMIFSNLVMFFIMVATASTLFRFGITDIATAGQAAEALRPLAGSASFILFTLGILGTGLLAVPVLAGSASYALSEVFGWREGLSKSYRQARAFYLVIALAIMLGALTNFLGVSPIRFLILTAVLNGLLAPVMLWFIIRLADRREVVGTHASPRSVRFGAWLTFAVMSISGIALIIQLLTQ
ncbi:MAG: Nramp family divalent metal transporter [Candidatus Kerfeldbacteria bacterium]|nr:Nramp family divalent metal transporter [Candidatus Kerfeldbacteria bacterium]